jgi:hypothetical protein
MYILIETLFINKLELKTNFTKNQNLNKPFLYEQDITSPISLPHFPAFFQHTPFGRTGPT